MRTRRDFLTPAIVIFGVAVVILFLWIVIADAQTHTMPGSNVVPSGSTLTISSGGTINAAAGSTVTGFSSNGLQWDGGSTNLVSATGRTSLALNNVTNDAQTKAAIVPNTAPAAGQILVGNAGATAYAPMALTGSGATMTLASNGLLTISAIAPASISTGANVGTFLTTPSSANLRGALTDENGTGAALFSGATAPDFTTGFTIGAAAASGKIPIGNGTNYVPSTPTWPTAAGTAGYTIRSDGTNFTSYPQDMFNSSVTSQATFSTSDIYITNSNVPVTAGDMKAKGQYKCVFDMTKSAGTGAIVISVRVGTAGAIGDAQILTFTFGAGTAVADTGTFEVIATWRTVGSGTSAVMQGICRAQKNAATTTGLWNNAGTDLVIVAATSAGFNSSTATNIGVSFNGSTAFAGTSTLCQATLIQ